MKRLFLLLMLILPQQCFAAGIGVSPDNIFFDENKQAQLIVFNPNNQAMSLDIDSDKDIFEFIAPSVITEDSARIIVKLKKTGTSEANINIRLSSDQDSGFAISPAVSIPVSVGKRTKKYTIKNLTEQDMDERSEFNQMLSKIPVPIKGAALSLIIVLLGICIWWVVRGGLDE